MSSPYRAPSPPPAEPAPKLRPWWRTLAWRWAIWRAPHPLGVRAHRNRTADNCFCCTAVAREQWRLIQEARVRRIVDTAEADMEARGERGTAFVDVTREGSNVTRTVVLTRF